MIRVSILILFLFFALGLHSIDSRGWIEKAVAREFAFYEKRGISLEAIEKTWQRVQRNPEFCRYKIIDSKVFGTASKIKNLLEELVKNYSIPDVDFIYFNQDRIKKSFTKRKALQNGAPVLVSAKEASLSQFILFSDWLYDPTAEESGWNALAKMINEHFEKWPWNEKIERLFWRGAPFDGNHFGMYRFNCWKEIPRGTLVYLSRVDSEHIDAAFSSYPPGCLREDPERCLREMGPQSFVPVLDQLQYKYHLIIDGVTCTYPATHWKLLSGSLTFKQASRDIMYFYPEMIPWKHYIPVRADLSDLIEKIEWAKNHDEIAHAIAQNGREFALTHLMREQILDYCRAILIRYSSLQTFQPRL